jgi:TRAP-type C4-dicarboxylate transport system permease small subunit
MSTPSPGDSPPRPPGGPLLYIGAAGLATAAAVETVAVAGRWLSLPLHGALEIIQAAILVTASVAMLMATLAESHATVHILINRAGPSLKVLLKRFAALLSAVLFLALATASLWLAYEHWGVHEASELLHIPFPPLRILCCLSMLAILGVFTYRAIKPRANTR